MRKFFFILFLMPMWGYAQQQLDLQQARQMALEHNRTLRHHTLEIKSSQLQRQTARSKFLPRLDAELGYQLRNKPYQLFESDKFLPVVPFQSIDPATGNLNPAAMQDPALAPGFLVFNPTTGELMRDAQGNPVFQHYAWLPKEEAKVGQTHNFRMGINLRQPLYMGGKIRSGLQIAYHADTLAALQHQLSVSEVVFRTDELYWQVIALEEKYQLTRDYLHMLQKLVEDLENLYAEGIITHNQVLQAKVKYNEVELLQTKASHGLQLSRMALNQHLGLPLHSQPILEQSLTMENLLITEENMAQVALEQRPELLMLNQAVAIAEQLIRVSQAEMLPSAGLLASYSASNPNPYNGFRDEFGGDYTLGVGISIPIYQFGEKRRDVARARIQKEQADLRRQETREMVELQVQQSLFNLKEASRRVELSSLSLQQARQNLEVTQNLFQEGRATTRDLLEAQAHWQEAHTARIEAQAGERLALTRLQKDLGIFSHH